MPIPTSERTQIMGVVNVTPDSFSDGGDHPTTETAVAHAHQLIAEGVDILDIGGESTRPGSARPSEEEELRRVVPVVEALKDTGVPLSIDTMRASVARAAIEAGAHLINDVSGGLADPDMLRVMAELHCPYIVMHWRDHGSVMQQSNHLDYEEVVADVYGELERRVEACAEAGIDPSDIILDPGIGFSKTADHNWELLRNVDTLARLGFPLLIGVSRKGFLGALLADGETPRPPKERDAATAAVTTLMAVQGVWAVRTHEVRANRDAIAVVQRMQR